MVTITGSSKVVSAVSSAVPIFLDAATVALLFTQFGDARSTDFSRAFIKDNAQVLLDCNSTQKWYMRYSTTETAPSDVLFLAITHKNKVSKGRIKPATRDISDESLIEEVETADMLA